MRESGDDGIDWEIENISYELICCMVKWEILSILPSIPYIRSFHSFIHISNFNQMVIYSITLFVLIKYTFYFTLCCAMQCQDMQMPCHNRDRMRWAAIQSDVMCSMYSQSFWISKFFYFQTIPSHPLVSAVPFASSSLLVLEMKLHWFANIPFLRNSAFACRLLNRLHWYTFCILYLHLSSSQMHLAINKHTI